MPSPLRRSGSGLLQIPRPGLLSSPNSAGLDPLGPSRVVLSTRQSSRSLRPCSFAPPRFDANLSIDAGEFASPLLWRLAGTGLTPADRSALRRAHHCLNSEI